jgi:peptide/nickel transport system permease protein
MPWQLVAKSLSKTPASITSPEPAIAKAKGGGFALRLLKHPVGAVSLFALMIFVIAALAAPPIAPYNPIKQNYGDELLPPSVQYWMGSDEFGRDIFSRVLFGIRLSFTVAIIAAVVGGSIGVVTGMLAGYIGGWLDNILGRIWDTLLAFPGLLLAMGVVVVLGPGEGIAAVAAAIINIPIIGRLARAEVLAQKEREYTQAAVAIGASTWRILVVHVFPNIFPAILVQITLTMAHAMLLEAGLSFLGLGAQPPDPSLGTMLRNARAYMREAVWLAIFPGLALTGLLITLSFLADAIRDIYDPRGKTIRPRT